MARTTHRARVVWEGGADGRAHRVEMGEQVLAASSAPEFGGEAAKAEDAADGILEGKAFTAATLRPRVGWKGEPPSAEQLADLHHRSHEACYIANSVSFPVGVEPG